MSPTRPFAIAAILGASSLLQAEDVATESTPVATPDKVSLAESTDPTTSAPLVSDLPATPAPTSNVTVNLINRLVQKGILSKEEAAEMISQAEADAQTAQQNAAAQADIAALPPAPSPDDMRVTYIPEVVKNNMRDEIKQELMATAREEQWAAKSAPDWTSKFRPFGDIRTRYDGTFFGDGNDDTGAFPNFNAINTSSTPFDTSGTQFSPQYNVNEDRKRTRLRARLGTDIMLGDGFNAGVRVATGESNSPTSPNQTLGGSGGDFSKYQIWLDRAFVSYDAGPGDGQELVFLLGRFDNPFFSTEILWDDDLGFDGLALRGKVRINDCASTFFTAGYFPVYNTDFNFASNQPSKFASTDKWLTGAQVGIDWKITDDLTAKFGIAYYDFDGISGELSDPFTPLSASDAGNTDTTRPGFAQRGNTYMALRDIVPTAANDFGTKYQYQYYGLASEFRNLTITGRLDYDHFDPVRLSLLGEVTKNIAFDSSAINKKAVNNRGPSAGNNPGAFEGGDTAWNLTFQVGKPAMEKFGDWQANFGYRYVESDAVVDGFTDSDFGGGGTNVQGYTLGGFMALSPAVRLGLRWMSSDEVAGPPLSTDVLQIDLNAKF
ncbi:MAG: putative porin [Verrucomicrobiota bacterium]